jgi:CrcB protein
MIVLAVALGGAAGSCLRAAIYAAMERRLGTGFPHATYLVNAIGSFVLGLSTAQLSAATAQPELQALVGIGFCASLTTFSSFSCSAWLLFEQGRTTAFAQHTFANLFFSFAAAWFGLSCG